MAKHKGASLPKQIPHHPHVTPNKHPHDGKHGERAKHDFVLNKRVGSKSQHKVMAGA